MKHTRGECPILEVQGHGLSGNKRFQVFPGDLEDNAITVNVNGKLSDEEAEGNAELIAEAFNVTNETGKTPRQLADINAGLLKAAKNALADLEGIMPEFEGSGDRSHPAWETINELKNEIKKATE